MYIAILGSKIPSFLKKGKRYSLYKEISSEIFLSYYYVLLTQNNSGLHNIFSMLFAFFFFCTPYYQYLPFEDKKLRNSVWIKCINIVFITIQIHDRNPKIKNQASYILKIKKRN